MELIDGKIFNKNKASLIFKAKMKYGGLELFYTKNQNIVIEEKQGNETTWEIMDIEQYNSDIEAIENNDLAEDIEVKVFNKSLVDEIRKTNLEW